MFVRSSQCATPNPDADCNRHIKFGVFREYVLNELRANFVATGECSAGVVCEGDEEAGIVIIFLCFTHVAIVSGDSRHLIPVRLGSCHGLYRSAVHSCCLRRRFPFRDCIVIHVYAGHYAKLAPAGIDGPMLYRGVDPVKDQSFFLCRVSPANFDRVHAA